MESNKDKTTEVRQQDVAPVYGECPEKVGLRRCDGVYEGRAYTTYYLTVGEDLRFKIQFDREKKSLVNRAIKFVPCVEEVGVE